jgi:hypothetical protein
MILQKQLNVCHATLYLCLRLYMAKRARTKAAAKKTDKAR